jgi:ABC-type dipeptide/oligopeptide/nickel transport system ATPase component
VERTISEGTLLQVRDLKISFTTAKGDFPAVRGISFDIGRNSIVGLVGESGCGKSVTALAIMRLLPSNAQLSGTIDFSGRNIVAMHEEEIRKLRGSEISMIFQEPLTSLNPLWKVGRQIDENLKMHTKMSGGERFRSVIDIMRDVGLPDPERLYHKYPHELSGGMRQRIAIAIAIACRPSLIIADEPTTALDVTIQAQILQLLKDINREKGSSIIFISHNFGIIREICTSVCVMYAGHLVEVAPTEKLFCGPEHPYTIGLMKAIPKIDSKGRELYDIPVKYRR